MGATTASSSTAPNFGKPAGAPHSAGAVVARKAGSGSRKGLTPAALALLDRIETQFGGVNVISGYRPGARIAGTGRISRHASGNAIDFEAGSRKGAIIQWLIANHKSGGTMTYADMSHIHVDIGQHFVSLSGGSGRGYASSRSRNRDYGNARYAQRAYSGERYVLALARERLRSSAGARARSTPTRHRPCSTTTAATRRCISSDAMAGAGPAGPAPVSRRGGWHCSCEFQRGCALPLQPAVK